MAHNFKNIREMAQVAITGDLLYAQPSGKNKGQCVTGLKNYYNEMTTVPEPFAARGDAYKCVTALVNQGYATKIDKPVAGAVLQYSAKAAGNNYGHATMAISETEMIEQNSAYKPNNGQYPNGTYRPRICPIRPGYDLVAMPQGYYEDAEEPVVPPVVEEPKEEVTETPSNELKVGDKVRITGKYASSSSSNIAVNSRAIGWERYITREIKGAKFPYQIGNKGKTDSANTTGWATSSCLEKL